MLKIIQTEPPTPTPNPFTFDPDTREGLEWYGINNQNARDTLAQMDQEARNG
jgi:hypothetical protein